MCANMSCLFTLLAYMSVPPSSLAALHGEMTYAAAWDMAWWHMYGKKALPITWEDNGVGRGQETDMETDFYVPFCAAFSLSPVDPTHPHIPMSLPTPDHSPDRNKTTNR